jgi:cytochrome c oxidase subunit I+III
VFVTMLADVTAFLSLVFAYFFFWTVHEDFPPASSPDPGLWWPSAGAGLVLLGWLLTIAADRSNRRDRGPLCCTALLAGAACALLGAGVLAAAPWRAGLDPAAHAYPAIVCLLAVWTALHVVVGVLMQIYCLCRRLRGRMTARRDIDVRNVVLYWHFTVLTAAITALVIGGFPEVA